MAVFMSEGLADIISMPDETVIDSRSILKLKIRELGERKILSVTFKEEHGMTSVIHMTGSTIRIKVGDESMSCKVSQAAFKASNNTISIKGIVLNTY